MRHPLLLLSFSLASAVLAQTASAPRPPNIVLIYADDLGFGDVHVNDPGQCRLKTPQMDRLAAAGLRFTDAHTTSATCTPSRYGLLTGVYPWREKGTGILPGDAKLIIPTDIPTLPSLLQKGGYQTAVVGKWHLGLGAGREEIDWNKPISPSPNDIGFSHSFIMAATGDRVPSVYIQNHAVVNLDPADPITVSYGEPIPGVPTGKDNPGLLKMKPSHGHNQSIVNGISRIGYMKGGEKARWKDEELSEEFTRQALTFIETNKEKPFFLYYAAHEPHVPRAPAPRFVGQSGLGPRGDAILQFDWSVGQILDTLDRLKLADNTLVILTSDNGPVLDDGYEDEAVKLNGTHRPAGPWRGGKYTAFEGGTRVPFIVRWPGKVSPGVSPALFGQIDLLATFAVIAGVPVPEGAAPDSRNALPALLGQDKTGRSELILQGGALTLRSGPWKFFQGAVRRRPNQNANPNGNLAQLYELSTDPSEQKNVAGENNAKVLELQARFQELTRPR